MEKEIWKDIPGFPGYLVSSIGNVKGPKGMLKSNSDYRRGRRVTLYRKGEPRHTFSVARLVAFTFLGGDIYDIRLTVNHIDGNRLNNDINNLELISNIENLRKGYIDGLHMTHRVDVMDINTGIMKTYPSTFSACRAMGKGCWYLSKRKNGLHVLGQYIVKIYPKNKYYFVDRGIPDFTKG